MLKIFLGDMLKAIYNTAIYFKNKYKEKWLLDPLTQEMIKSVDKSDVLGGKVIDSPYLGLIPPTGLSGGVKTLILIQNEPKTVFNASTCGDNCAKWLLALASKVMVTLISPLEILISDFGSCGVFASMDTILRHTFSRSLRSLA